jgi:hypothetical protein
MRGCRLELDGRAVVDKRVVFEGREASGAVLDCNGAILRKIRDDDVGPRIAIISKRNGADGWQRPSDIVIRDCTIEGPVQIYGMGRRYVPQVLLGRAYGDELLVSSRRPGHTQRVQEAAPTRIRLERVTLIGTGTAIPLYVSVGVTEVELIDSTVSGRSASTAIYLDAESSHNTIVGNTISLSSQAREQIAIDGSAHNRIERNVFENSTFGAVHIYRNCGEEGGIRHLEPTLNAIRDNTFRLRSASKRPLVWVSSRDTTEPQWREFCALDDGFGLGSSADDRSLANDNSVTYNTFVGVEGEEAIKIGERGNTASRNVFVRDDR